MDYQKKLVKLANKLGLIRGNYVVLDTTTYSKYNQPVYFLSVYADNNPQNMGTLFLFASVDPDSSQADFIERYSGNLEPDVTLAEIDSVDDLKKAIAKAKKLGFDPGTFTKNLTTLVTQYFNT